MRAFMVARALPREALHPTIAKKVWLDFMRGDFEQAAARAMKRVEVRLREVSGLPKELVGVKLARAAFAPGDIEKGREPGPLTPFVASAPGQDGRSVPNGDLRQGRSLLQATLVGLV